MFWFTAEGTSADHRLLVGLSSILLILLLNEGIVPFYALAADLISAARLARFLRKVSRKGLETNDTVVGGRQWSEQISTLQFLLELLCQCIQLLANILRCKLSRPASLRLLTLLAHVVRKKW